MTRPRKYNYAAILALHDSGESIRAIAARLGCTRHLVRRILRIAQQERTPTPTETP